MAELDKQEQNTPQRDEKGRLLPGSTANPNGRPKGQSLKEFWRQRFQEMSYEEKVEFTKKVGNDVVWKMAEGNPKNDIEHSGTLNISTILNDIENDRSAPDNKGMENSEPLQDQGQKEEPNQI